MSRTLEADKVTPAQLAVDPQVEKRKLAHTTFHLKAGSKRPDVLELEWRLLADDLALGSMARDEQRWRWIP
jgi:hypothetical protein